jgi:hypothetical protein
MTDPAQYDPEAEAPLLSQDILDTGQSMGFLYGGPDYQQYQMLRLADRAKAVEARTTIDHDDAALVLHPNGGQDVLLPKMGEENAPAQSHAILVTALATRLTNASFVQECLDWLATLLAAKEPK